MKTVCNMNNLYSMIDDRIQREKVYSYTDGVGDLMRAICDDDEIQSMDNGYEFSKRVIELCSQVKDKIK